jgi:endogenous inhibitor of DNA gyrase (YacG/DUF329 family)
MARSNPKAGAGGKCPICERPTVQEYRPFCSRRCADIDLSRWLSGAYAIPVKDGDHDEDGTSPADGGKNEPGTTH